ncbi:hypothetical protein [Pseudomonas sp. DR48]|uniref:hypothetical protein n=1 Tax=Pseudomonas sp. DR48 TaxID=2871095 RepID=UPI001C996641|nr:hypothetical protein [Pseudomonas sp. DR48]QZP31648.1 hypothetical protein K5K95_26310 [Pseudomonas sp. DR48]
MAKRNFEKPALSASNPIAISTQDSAGLESHRNRMAGALLGISIVWVATVVLVAVHAPEIMTRIKVLNTGVQVCYAVIALAFILHRHHLRRLMVSASTFVQGMNTDIGMAKRFNNIELLKAVTTYALVFVPALHFSGLFDPVFIYFGFTPSSVTNSAVQWLTSAIAFFASNALAGIIGGIAYDHFRRNPPKSATE